MLSLLEITLNKLYNSTVDAFPNTKKRQHKVDTVSISNIKYIPYEGSNLLKIEATAVSGPNRYTCSMVFEDVYFEKTTTPDLITFKGIDGREYNVYKIDSGINDVKVKCTCMDFYYRFAQANYQNKGLDGNPPPIYIKKTDRPSANPENTPGLCKHLIKLREHLEIIGLLR